MSPFIVHAAGFVRDSTAELLRAHGASVTEVDDADEAVVRLLRDPSAVLVCQGVPPVARWARCRRVVPLGAVDGAVARRLAAAGAEVVSPAPRTVGALLAAAFADGTPVADPPAPAETDPVVLTPRQAEVIRLIGHGLTSHEIADEMGVRPKTVENYKQRAFSRLQVQNQAHAVARCARLGLVPVEPTACFAS